MSDTIAAAELRSFVERVERIDEEIRTHRDDRKDVLDEAKGRGYDKKAILEIVKLRKKDPNERQEEEAILETYKNSLGLV